MEIAEFKIKVVCADGASRKRMGQQLEAAARSMGSVDTREAPATGFLLAADDLPAHWSTADVYHFRDMTGSVRARKGTV
jgi:hypothetical protein